MRFLTVLWLSVCLLAAPCFAYPQRIISGMPAITEMLYALNLGDEIVGVTTNCNYPPEAARKEKVGGFFLNLESIVALKPDMVVLQEDAQQKDIKKFRSFGLPVFTINPKSVDGVMEAMLALGKAAGRRSRAMEITANLRYRINRVKEKTQAYRPALGDVLELWNEGSKQRKALVIVGFDPLVVAGRDTFIDDVLKCAGVGNVAAGSYQYQQYSFERLVSDNPQYIVIPAGLINKKTITSNARWRSLEAVRTDRILFINADILSRPGPRVVQAIEQISGFVY
jgi:iron complex transport system substrate-binding protein